MSGPAAPRVAPDACSVLSDDVREGAWGTAPQARFWLALEQPGPWGRQAATQSHLDPEVGAELDRRVRAAGGRFTLIRRPGYQDVPPPPDAVGRRMTGAQAALTHEPLAIHDGVVDPPSVTGMYTVLLAGCEVDREWILIGQVGNATELFDLDLEAVAANRVSAVHASLPQLQRPQGPQLLVCTNGRRDVCCATRGRPVAVAAAAQRPGQVWEASHTGGHRFAPTGVLLPHGVLLGRLDADLAVRVLDASWDGGLPADLDLRKHYRGRSALSAVSQAAEAAARERLVEERFRYLRTGAEFEVDGARWVPVYRRDDDPVLARVELVDRPGGLRPESCGAAELQVKDFAVALFDPPLAPAAVLTQWRRAEMLASTVG